jgi:hypothetical protein
VRVVGVLLLVAGIVGMLVGLSMTTSVSVDSPLFGKTEVHNIGLMDDRRNTITISGILVLLGGMVIGFSHSRGSGSAPLPPLASDARHCPFCGECIKRAAVVCRFCGKDVPPSAEPSSLLATLIAELGSSDAAVRERAASALGDLGRDAAPALDGLRLARRDQARRVRIRAAWAVERIEKSV